MNLLVATINAPIFYVVFDPSFQNVVVDKMESLIQYDILTVQPHTSETVLILNSGCFSAVALLQMIFMPHDSFLLSQHTLQQLP